MKKIGLLLFAIISCITLTGCFKKDNFDGINIYTTAYPIEYITTYLYGEHSTVNSIYPDGSNIEKYTLTNKQIKEYSSTDLYIFNGLGNEKNYVQPMFKNNKNLMIIDATQSMEVGSKPEELWLNPSNFLMIALNVKNGLLKYIDNHYLIEEIEGKYEELKVTVSNLDAKLKLMSENSENKTIIVDNNSLKFLEKYGFTVISLEEDDALTDKVVNDAISMIKKGDLNYIYTLDEENLNKTVKKVIKKTNAKTIELHKINTLKEDERKSKEDYLSLMNENIEYLKEELYN